MTVMLTECIKKRLFILSQLCQETEQMNMPVVTQSSIAASATERSRARNTLRLLLRTAHLWVK